MSERPPVVDALLPETSRKLPYVKPAIVTEKLFEAAAGCGKVNPTSFTCARITKAS
jgi:hypothetical protein